MEGKMNIGVLAERIRNYHEETKACIAELKEQNKEIKYELEQNTDFRKQAKTTLGLVTMIATFVGGLVMFVMNKFWR